MKCLPVVVLAALACSGILRAERPSLLDYKGQYKTNGKTRLTYGSDYRGPADGVFFSSKKSGLTGEMKVKGDVKANTTVEMDNEFSFGRKKLTVSRIAPGLNGGDVETTGTYRVRKNKIMGSGTFEPNPEISWKLSVSTKKRGRKLEITAIYQLIGSSGEFYRCTYSAKRPLRKSEL